LNTAALVRHKMDNISAASAGTMQVCKQWSFLARLSSHML